MIHIVISSVTDTKSCVRSVADAESCVGNMSRSGICHADYVNDCYAQGVTMLLPRHIGNINTQLQNHK